MYLSLSAIWLLLLVVNEFGWCWVIEMTFLWCVLLCFSVNNCFIMCELLNVCSTDVIVTNTLDESAEQLCIASGDKGRCVLRFCLWAHASIQGCQVGVNIPARWPPFVSDIAIFVLKRDIKLQPHKPVGLPKVAQFTVSSEFTVINEWV